MAGPDAAVRESSAPSRGYRKEGKSAPLAGHIELIVMLAMAPPARLSATRIFYGEVLETSISELIWSTRVTPVRDIATRISAPISWRMCDTPRSPAPASA